MEVKALQQLLSQFRQVQENLHESRIFDSVHVEASAGGGHGNHQNERPETSHRCSYRP